MCDRMIKWKRSKKTVECNTTTEHRQIECHLLLLLLLLCTLHQGAHLTHLETRGVCRPHLSHPLTLMPRPRIHPRVCVGVWCHVRAGRDLSTLSPVCVEMTSPPTTTTTNPPSHHNNALSISAEERRKVSAPVLTNKHTHTHTHTRSV